MKEKNVIRLPENNVEGGGVENNPGWGFSNEYFLVEPGVNWIYFVSSLKFRIPDQDGFEHISLL